MIVRNSAECAHCGEVVTCTAKFPAEWVTHRCDDGSFSIGGGAREMKRMGSTTDYQETTVYQNVIAVSCSANPEKRPVLLPETFKDQVPY